MKCEEVKCMDEWVDELKAISRVSPVQKLSLARPRKDRRELMYQLNQYHSTQKPKRTTLVTTKKPNVSKSPDSSSVLNTNELAEDIKKRIAFDRAMIIDDWNKL